MAVRFKGTGKGGMLGVAEHTCNPGTQEAEVEDCRESEARLVHIHMILSQKEEKERGGVFISSLCPSFILSP